MTGPLPTCSRVTFLDELARGVEDLERSLQSEHRNRLAAKVFLHLEFPFTMVSVLPDQTATPITPVYCRSSATHAPMHNLLVKTVGLRYADESFIRVSFNDNPVEEQLTPKQIIFKNYSSTLCVH